MQLDMSRVSRIGIDKLVLSGIKVETNKKSTITEGQGWIEEKFELREELFSIVKSIKLYETGVMVEGSYLRFNPNKIIYGHNILNARAPELREAVKKLVGELNSRGITIELTNAKVSEIEININIEKAFKEYKEVLTLLFTRIPNLRKIGNFNLNESYQKLFVDSTLYGGWENHKVIAYDKRKEVNKEWLLDFDLLRIEWWLSSSSYKYYAGKFGRDNTLELLMEDSEILDEIFKELCLKKLFKDGCKYLEEELVPNLERGYIAFRERNKLAVKKGRAIERNVFKHLDENYWIFDYSYLIDLISKHDKRHRGREIERIRKRYIHLNNKDKLSYLMDIILHH
jgi:hypothetical protein